MRTISRCGAVHWLSAAPGHRRTRRQSARDSAGALGAASRAKPVSSLQTRTVFRRYDIVSPNDLRVAVERLDAVTSLWPFSGRAPGRGSRLRMHRHSNERSGWKSPLHLASVPEAFIRRPHGRESVGDFCKNRRSFLCAVLKGRTRQLAPLSIDKEKPVVKLIGRAHLNGRSMLLCKHINCRKQRRHPLRSAKQAH